MLRWPPGRRRGPNRRWSNPASSLSAGLTGLWNEVKPRVKMLGAGVAILFAEQSAAHLPHEIFLMGENLRIIRVPQTSVLDDLGSKQIVLPVKDGLREWGHVGIDAAWADGAIEYDSTTDSQTNGWKAPLVG